MLILFNKYSFVEYEKGMHKVARIEGQAALVGEDMWKNKFQAFRHENYLDPTP